MKIEIIENGYRLEPKNVEQMITDLLDASKYDPDYKLVVKKVDGVLVVRAKQTWGYGNEI